MNQMERLLMDETEGVCFRVLDGVHMVFRKVNQPEFVAYPFEVGGVITKANGMPSVAYLVDEKRDRIAACLFYREPEPMADVLYIDREDSIGVRHTSDTLQHLAEEIKDLLESAVEPRWGFYVMLDELAETMPWESPEDFLEGWLSQFPQTTAVLDYGETLPTAQDLYDVMAWDQAGWVDKSAETKERFAVPLRGL